MKQVSGKGRKWVERSEKKVEWGEKWGHQRQKRVEQRVRKRVGLRKNVGSERMKVE